MSSFGPGATWEEADAFNKKLYGSSGSGNTGLINPQAPPGTFPQPIGAFDTFPQPIGAFDTFQKPIGAFDTFQKPIGAFDTFQKPIGTPSATAGNPQIMQNTMAPTAPGVINQPYPYTMYPTAPGGTAPYNVQAPTFDLGTADAGVTANGPLTNDIYNPALEIWQNILRSNIYNDSVTGINDSVNTLQGGGLTPYYDAQGNLLNYLSANPETMNIMDQVLGQNSFISNLATQQFSNPNSTQIAPIEVSGVSSGGPGYKSDVDSGALLNQLLNTPGFFDDEQNASLLAELSGANPWFSSGPQADSLNFLMNDVLYADSNPYLQSYMDMAFDPLIEDFERKVLPSIQDRFAQAGQTGSSRQGVAEGIALGDLAGDITRERGRMASDAYTTGLDAMLQGLDTGAQDYRGTLGRRLEALGLGSDAVTDRMNVLGDIGTQMAGLEAGSYEAAQNRKLQASSANASNELSAQKSTLEAQLGAMGLDTQNTRLMLDALNSSQGNVLASQALAGSMAPRVMETNAQIVNSAISNAPMLAKLGLLPAEIVGQIGSQNQEQAQRAINDAVAAWNFYQNMPQEELMRYAQLLSEFNKTASSSTQVSGGGAAGAIGGGIGGLQLGADFADLFTGWGSGGNSTDYLKVNSAPRTSTVF